MLCTCTMFAKHCRPNSANENAGEPIFILCNNLNSLNPSHSSTVSSETSAPTKHKTNHFLLYIAFAPAFVGASCGHAMYQSLHFNLSFSPLTRQCQRGRHYISSNVISHSYSWSRQNRIMATTSRSKPPKNHSNSTKNWRTKTGYAMLC